MTLTQIEHVFRELLYGLRRNLRSHLAPVTLMASALFVFGLFVIGTVNLRETIRIAQERVGIAIYLRDDADEADRAELEEVLSRLGGVRAVRYRTKEEALESFRATLGSRAYLLEGVEGNPLPASFELDLYDDWKFADRMGAMAEEIRRMPGVDVVVWGESWVESLERWIYFFVAMDLFLGAALGVSTLLVVGNTMKLAIEGRRDAIQVLRLVGARPWQIRLPFLMEGALLGLLAAAIALFLLDRSWRFAVERLSGVLFLGGGGAAAFLLFGAVLGGCGSLLSLHRYLRVKR
ncbi:MAG: ABC transporter permease [Candidatus Eisenbacteria bacterium]|nr:ABC transporter permease [Candidatus Eisenbacteria bacterium]